MQYQQLAADHLSDADEESLLGHLERCDLCARKLSTLVERDRLVEFIRRYQARGDGAADEGMGRLIERMSKLRPGETSAAVQTTPPMHNTAPVAALIFACPACGKSLKIKGEFAGKMVKCPHCQQAVCATAKSAGAPGTVAGAGHRTGANATGKLENTVDHQPASGLDKELYAFLAPPQAPDELGRLGPYRVLQVLGAGGMGVVFRAEDPQLMRLVALKAMLPALAASASARQRFLREARAAAAIKHDHIVTIYQVGEDRGVPFLAMDFLEGEPLDARLQRVGKLPVAEVLRIGREIALGLAAANQRGLIHRDIKPANIWLESRSGEPGALATGGRVKILDFGLARAVGAEAQLTQLGAVVGTPAYMAPEQGKGKAVDHRCDLFSLGCVLYHMATGKPAFRGSDIVSTLMAVATEHPRPPHELDVTVPAALSELILSLLAKEPGDRPPSAQAVAESLEGIAAVSAASRVAPTLFAAPQAPPRRRKKWPLLAGVASCLLLVLAGLWAAGVFKLKTKDGTIVLENLPAEAEVFVDGEKVAVKLPGDGQPIEIEVAPGTRKLKIKAAGFKMEAQEVTLASGERRPIGIRLEPLAVAAEKTALPLKYTNSLGMEFALVPKGEFLMGGGAGTVGAKEVSITNDFYLGKYEVTQGEWEAVTGVNPSYFRREGGGRNDVVNVRNEELKRFPVEAVSWRDAQLFLEALNKREKEAGWLYRLPKEAEWEYACRGGATSNKFDYAFDFYFDKPAKELLPGQANTEHGKGLKRTCKVGSYKPNRLGLYDMHGNVAEWCDNAQRVADQGSHRVSRGGDWEHLAWCRTAWRRIDTPVFRCQHIGFRVARVPVETANPTPPSPNAESAPKIVPPPPCAALEALRRDQIAPEALKLAGDGDAKRAPASLVAVLGEAQPIHNENVHGLAFSPDGRLLASASDDKTILLRDVVTGRVIHVLKGHTGPVSSVAFSKDSRTLASASHDGTLKLWPIEEKAEPETLQPKLGEIGALAASADGRYLASGGKNGALKLWKWGQWKSPVDISTEGGWVTTLAFSPDGEILASGWDVNKPVGPIRIYKTADGTLLQTLAGNEKRIHSLSFSRNGKSLASVGAGRKINVWNPVTGDLNTEITVAAFGIVSVAFGPDDSSLAICMAFGQWVQLYDVSSQKLLRTIFEAGSSPLGVAFSPDGKHMAVGAVNGVLHVVDTTTWKQKYLEGSHRHFVGEVVFSHDGRTVLSAGDDLTLRSWDLARPGENKIVHESTGHIGLLTYSPDGKTFATYANVWDAASGKVSFALRGLSLGKLAYRPDGKLLAAGYGNNHGMGEIRLSDVTRGKEVHQFLFQGTWNGLGFSADGKTLAGLCLRKNQVKIWNVATGAEIRDWQAAFNPKSEFMPAAAFGPDLGLLAIGHDNGTIDIWDVAQGQKKRTLPGHTARLVLLKFTRDGKTLVSSAQDGTIRLWNPESERAREVISLGPTNRGPTFDLDPSGRYLAAAGHSPVIFVLRLPQDSKQTPP